MRRRDDAVRTMLLPSRDRLPQRGDRPMRLSRRHAGLRHRLLRIRADMLEPRHRLLLPLGHNPVRHVLLLRGRRLSQRHLRRRYRHVPGRRALQRRHLPQPVLLL
jgi:hypothetical protein